MPILDTGLLVNREARRTGSVTIHVMNRGRQQATAGIQIYSAISPQSKQNELKEGEVEGGSLRSGYGKVQMERSTLVQLQPEHKSESTYTLKHDVSRMPLFGVRITTTGLAAGEVIAAVIEHDELGELIAQHQVPVSGGAMDEMMHAYIANHTQHSITVIQTATHTRIATIPLPVGSSPRSLDFTPDGREVYVICQGDKIVRVLDTLTHEVTGLFMFPQGAVPIAVAIAKHASMAFITTLVEDYLIIVDTATRSLVKLVSLPRGSDPVHMAIAPDGKRVYCCLINKGAIAILDTVKQSLLPMIKLPTGAKPSSIAITPDGTLAYVTDVHHDRIYVIRLATNTILTMIKLDAGADPQKLAITPDGALGYVAARGGDEVTVINLSRNEILTQIELPGGSNASDLVITPDGAKVYVTILTFGYVAAIEVASQLPIAILPTGSFPSGIAITPILLH